MKKYSVNYRRFITVTTLLLLTLFALGVLIFKWVTKEKFSDDYLEVQSIKNDIKLNIRPFEIKPEKKVSLYVQIESYQNTSLLYADLKKVVFIKDSNGELYLPTSWKQEGSSSPSRKGILVFPALKGKPTYFTLYLFSPEEVTLTWLLKIL